MYSHVCRPNFYAIAVVDVLILKCTIFLKIILFVYYLLNNHLCYYQP